MTNPRIIHTHLYSKEAYDIFDSLMGQISDGYWENSDRMQKYWNFAEICREINGEVVIKVDGDSYVWDKWSHRMSSNPYASMPDNKIREFFANKMKIIAKVEMEDENAGNMWKRDSEMTLHYLGRDNNITVRDIYYIYDVLHGRKTEGRYPDSLVKKLIGEPKHNVAIAPWLLAI